MSTQLQPEGKSASKRQRLLGFLKGKSKTQAKLADQSPIATDSKQVSFTQLSPKEMSQAQAVISEAQALSSRYQSLNGSIAALSDALKKNSVNEVIHLMEALGQKVQDAKVTDRLFEINKETDALLKEIVPLLKENPSLKDQHKNTKKFVEKKQVSEAEKSLRILKHNLSQAQQFDADVKSMANTQQAAYDVYTRDMKPPAQANDQNADPDAKPFLNLLSTGNYENLVITTEKARDDLIQQIQADPKISDVDKAKKIEDAQRLHRRHDLLKKYQIDPAEYMAIRAFSGQDYKYINPATANQKDIEGIGDWADSVTDYNPKLTALSHADLQDDSKVKPALARLQKAETYKHGTSQDKGSKQSLSQEGALHAAIANKGLAKLPKHPKVTVYRGEVITKEIFDRLYPVGKQMKSESLRSFSLDESIARSFVASSKDRGDTDVLLELVSNQLIDIGDLSAVPGENELTMKPGLIYKIIKVTEEAPINVDPTTFIGRPVYRVHIECIG